MGWLKRFTGKQDPDPQPEQPSPQPNRPDSQSEQPTLQLDHPIPQPKLSIDQWDRLPDLPNPDTEPVDGVRIGESPIPGLTLKRILRGHENHINRIAWSPDGRLLASPSEDGTIRIWDVVSGNCVAVLEGHSDKIFSVAWSPDGHILASGAKDYHVRLWDIQTKRVIRTLKYESDYVFALAWSPSDNYLAGGNYRSIWIGDTDDNKEAIGETTLRSWVAALAWSSDGQVLASGGGDGQLGIWDVKSKTFIEPTIIDNEYIYCVAWSSDGSRLAFAGEGKKISIWDAINRKNIKHLESHTKPISSISFSCNDTLFASKSSDGTVRIWQSESWQGIGRIAESSSQDTFPGLAFHPIYHWLATLGANNTVIRIWEIDEELLLGNSPTVETVNYTTAKLVLVGDSGVGKTGLGWRLAHGEFKEHASTHGQQFWVVNELKTRRADKTQCEAVLWDLAGQPIYRTSHAIFLDDVDLALLLFDPTKPQESLNGVEFWMKQLAGKKELPPSVLVGARLDRGAGTLTEDELQQFCQRHGISGGYIGTSAFTGEGLYELMERLQVLIPWDSMTTTVTTVTFKRVKDFVLELKEQPDREHVLVTPDELREQLQATDSEWEFTDDEMMTAVGHLQTHGYVNVLRSSSGEKYILLMPDLLVTLVASIILQANKHPQSLGALSETALLRGDFVFDELANLTKDEREILLDAAVLLFIEHNICFRETLGAETLLIFPSQIQQKRPLLDNVETVEDVSYIVRGAVENVYSALVVLLGYTRSFNRVNQWQNQAQYEMSGGQICGFRQIADLAGEIELILYYAPTTPDFVRNMFQGLFENFLYQREVKVTRYPPLFCENDHLQERATVIRRLRENKHFLFCPECGERVALPEVEEPIAPGEIDRSTINRGQREAQLRKTYELHLSRIKGFRRDRTAPRCFVSHLPTQTAWAVELMSALRDAGVFVVEDRTQIRPDDFILLVMTPAYQMAWQSRDATLAFEFEMIQSRLERLQNKSPYIIPLLLDGRWRESCPVEVRTIHHGDFSDRTRHFVALYDVVLSLYAIPFNHPAFEKLREDLGRQWEEMLARTAEASREVFISYGWGGKSEEITNELDQAFQGRGVTITRDKRDLNFKGRIQEFMQSIGKGKCVILVISEKYLKSPNCMFELLQVAKHGEFEARIFPVVLDDANIYDPVGRLEYVKYWEQKITELDEALKGVSSANLHGFREDIDLYTEIRAHLPRLANILKDMNTLTTTIHQESNFEELFNAVMDRLEA